MSEVILEGWAIHEDVVKENSDEVAEEGFRSSFMVAWKVDGALHKPNDMTLYS